MKTKLFGIVIISILLACTFSCSDDENVGIRNFNFTHCKQVTKTSEMSSETLQDLLQEKVFYKAKGNYLQIKHENALHNCYEENKVVANVKVDGDKIIIQTIDTDPMANCVCAYDLNYEVGPLSYGKYVIYIDSHIEFPIDFSSSTDGVWPD